MKWLIIISFSIISTFYPAAGKTKVVTHFNSEGTKKVGLTFDACQSKTPAHFDKAILDYIVANKIPVSIFVSGRFALENEKQIRFLARNYPFIEFENHS